MRIHNFSKENSILNNFMSEIRSISIQQDRMRFRRNIERIGEILCYEMSKTLTFKKCCLKTPLGEMSLMQPSENFVICSVLRAGLPLHNGVLNYFDNAENAFISAYRHHKSKTEFEIVVEYIASPSIEGKTLILVDPMLATGQSIVSTYKALLSHGTPKNTHIISVLGAKKGVTLTASKFPKNTQLWIAGVDEDLNDKGYIVPGLGDAGDLSFGIKLKH